MSDQDNDGEIETEEDSLAQRRSRRSRNDKTGRLAALEKLKNARQGGAKNKYEVKEVENVYDVVDEDTYSRKVNDRLQDDWIVDDGTGYCETGHELFDDDIIDEDDYGRSSKKDKTKAKKDKTSKEEREKQRENFISVRDMLSNMPAKRKREPATSSTADAVNEDDLLGEMLRELNETKKPRTSIPGVSKSSLPLMHRSTERPSQPKWRPTVLPPLSTQPKLEPEPLSTEPLPSSLQFKSSHQSEQQFPMELEPPCLTSGFEDAESFETPVVVKQEKLQLEVEDFEIYRKNDVTKISDQSDVKIECMTMDGSGTQKILNFYWFDIYEEPKNPGFLYLFGKVASQGVGGGYVSCCIVIQNVQRYMYILPKDKLDDGSDVTFVDVYGEFEKMAPKLKIHEFKARKVEKKYCFGEENVPSVSEYMEVCYSGALPPFPEDLCGKTFSRVFGAHSSMLENFLLRKKLKGPCWLQISGPIPVDSAQQQSWCKMEFASEVGNIQIHAEKDSVNVPPFVVASLNINAVNDATSKKDTIICASVVVNKAFKINSSVASEGLFHDSFCLLHKPPGEVWPFDVDRVLSKFTTKMDSERSMLACFLAKLAQFDPDIYVGHDLNFYLLLLQLWNHKVPHWSRIGRLKRSSQPQKGGKMPDSKSAVAGRLVCDVKVSAMELIRARSYDLPSLATQVLGLKEDQVSSYTGTELRQLFESSEGIQHLAAWGMSLSILNLRLVNELQVMPLALQITTIAGNTLARTLMGGRSERNEFLLLHAFFNKNYIVPDKQFRKRFKREDDDDDHEKKGKSSGPSYLGGLVLEPKKGFYDNFIVLMDFNSLYPSIIQEFNICFTTSTTEDHTDETVRGILPEEIRVLVESRREVKKLMQAENVSVDLKKQYDIRQKALKLTANSMYGCLGFRNSRFYAKHLAALITGKGRDILLKTKEAVEKMGFEVIYGDTDSIMINTNSQDIQRVYQIGNKIKTEINRMHKLLELEIDGVFRFLLLLKKKKYAATIYTVKSNGDIETSLELKGLDMVRRDWAPIAASTARSVLDEIMSEQAIDDKIFKIVKILSDTAEELRAGRVSLKNLLITKQLAKNPEEYKKAQGLYHVEVALKMNQSGKLPRKFKNGDTVPYVFCTDGQPHHPTDLMGSKVIAKREVVKNADEESKDVVKQETVLQPDAEYYLSQQVHPVVSRICEPIPGLDAARIAEALGLDPSSYKKRRQVEHSQEDVTLGELSEAEKYKDCEPFKFLCPNIHCRKEISLKSPVTIENGVPIFTLSKCPNEKCSQCLYLCMPHICNSLVLFMRRFIAKYYEGWFECEDPACDNRDRAVNLKLVNGYLVCPCEGTMMREYSDFDLNRQLNYLLYAFDVQKMIEEDKDLQTHKDTIVKQQGDDLKQAIDEFSRLRNLVVKQLSHSAFSEIKLGELFAELIPKSTKFGFSKDESSYIAAT